MVTLQNLWVVPRGEVRSGHNLFSTLNSLLTLSSSLQLSESKFSVRSLITGRMNQSPVIDFLKLR